MNLHSSPPLQNKRIVKSCLPSPCLPAGGKGEGFSCLSAFFRVVFHDFFDFTKMSFVIITDFINLKKKKMDDR